MNESVGAIAPAIAIQFTPSVEYLHWTFGVGVPDAPAVKLTNDPDVAVTLTGCVMMTGAEDAAVTVSGTEFVVAEPTEFEKTAT